MRLTARRAHAVLATFGALLILAAFVLEHGLGVRPCPMCWWQRYAHWAIFAAALTGLAAPRLARVTLAAALLAALAGLGLALWQFAAQHHWLPWPESCTSTSAQLLSTAADLLATLNNTPIVPCDKETFTFAGLSLAAWNIPAMLFALALSAAAFRRRA